jgi:hypothetical protein
MACSAWEEGVAWVAWVAVEEVEAAHDHGLVLQAIEVQTRYTLVVREESFPQGCSGYTSLRVS